MIGPTGAVRVMVATAVAQVLVSKYADHLSLYRRARIDGYAGYRKRSWQRPACVLLVTRFIDDGRIEFDNNTLERSIRLIALSRKNALFAGSDGGAEHWATINSQIETCKLIDVDPLACLTNVLTRIINGHPNSDIELPWSYRQPDLTAVA